MPARRRRPTLKDIAADTGLSTAAVSYALRGLQVPQETQDRVRDAADRLGYEAHPAARALASGRSGTVGVVCGSLQDLWQQDLAAALGRALLEADLNALIVDVAGDPQREAPLSRRLSDQRVDAMVTIAVDPRGAHWRDVAEEVVVVAIGDDLPDAPTKAEVVFDNRAGVEHALRTLAEAGHTRVAVLTPGHGGSADRPADRAVLEQASALGLRVDLHHCPHDLVGATAVALQALDTPDAPTAFFCLADSMAYGAYAAVQQRRMRIPDDVSVLGYDDRPVSRLLTPPLSTYRWEIETIVAATVDRVTTALQTGRRRRQLMLQPEPQLRGSVGPAPR